MRKAIIISLVVLSLVIVAVPAIAVEEEYDAKEFSGELKIYEKGKPTGTPTKPPKPGDDEPTDPDPTVNKWAVVIGIADYYGVYNDLKYTDDDAKDVYNYLRSMGYPAGNIKLLLDSQATAKNILDALDWLDTYENEDSEVVFFYSGHGTTLNGADDGDGEYTDEAIVSYELLGILDTTLAIEIGELESDKVGIMFDSCFSGGMTDMAGPGRVLSTACGETELSYDGTAKMKNGVWTYYFLQGLKTYDTIEQAHTYAASLASGFISANYGRIMTPVLDDQYSDYWSFV